MDEVEIWITPDQVQQLLANPNFELVYYVDGTRIAVRIREDFLVEDETVH